MSVTAVMRCVVLMAGCAATVVSSGCFVSRTGAVAAARPGDPGLVWPERDVDAVRPYAEATPAEIRRGSVPDGVELPDDMRAFLDQVDYRFDYCKIVGNGMLRRYVRGESTSLERDGKLQIWAAIELLLEGFLPNAEFLSSELLVSEPNGYALLQARFPAEPTPEAAAEDPVVTMRERIAFQRGVSLYLPDAGDRPARGVILHFAALYWNPYEMLFLQRMREAGWEVFSIKPISEVTPPLVPEHMAEAEVLESRLRSIRDALKSEMTHENMMDPAWHPTDRSAETKKLQWRIKALVARLFQACPGDDLSGVGADIAARVDNLLAESAYAAEAVVGYIDAERPDLVGKPLVVMGFSAGALAAPAACARLGERVDAVVLIGGGADLFAISQESTLTDAGVRIRCGFNFVDPRTIEAIHHAYLAHTTLDPIKTAPLLAATPTLVIRSDSDEWVPARYGRLLVEKLGRPDVQTLYGGGHKILFWRLPGRAPSILRWLDRVTPDAAGEDSAAAR